MNLMDRNGSGSLYDGGVALRWQRRVFNGHNVIGGGGERASR